MDKKISPVRILLGGSPCTYWSISQHPSKRETICSGQGWELFLNYVIAKEKFKPDFFIYENNESISKTIQNEIEHQLGVELLHINSASFSAQSRKRIYGTNIQVPFIPDTNSLTVKDIIDDSYIGEDLSLETNFLTKPKTNTLSHRIGTIGKGGQGERVYSINGKSVTLSANGGGRGAKTGLYLIHDRVRKLNVLEAERLQTLPDDYTKYGKDGIIKEISNTARYKCIGNGWTAEVICYLLSFMNISKDTPIEVLSLYDGIATGLYCLKHLGYKNIIYKAYEIDKVPKSIALYNHPDIIQFNDAFDIRKEEWSY